MKEGNEVRSMMRQPTSSIEEEKKNQQPQAFGSFYDENGEKYCAVSVLSKYLGYDIAAGVSKKIRNYKKNTKKFRMMF